MLRMCFSALPLGVDQVLPPNAADLLVAPVFEDDDFQDVPDLRAALGQDWARARSGGEVTGKPFDIFTTPAAVACGADRVALVGAGPRVAFDADVARRVAAAGALFARQRRAPRVALQLRAVEHGSVGARTAERIVQAAAEGLTLAQLDTARHKSTVPDGVRLEGARLVVPRPALTGAVRVAAERGRVLAEATNIARALGNEPGNLLPPRVLADRAVAVTERTGLAVDILDEQRIRDLGMGLLLAVAQGSAEPPRLIVLQHEPEGVAPQAPVLGFVGKGITFDTGGISIKPADGMDRMKVDMAGGAAVVGALRALALLQAPIRVIAVVPSSENMPGGRAMRPGDVVRSASGKTVEVVNTDGEGRLILGDALWYARHLGATHLVDVATLTGACMIALGRHASGLFGRPDDWVERVRRAGQLAGERCWPMPTWDEYFDQMKSEVADMTNSGGRPAGAVTAALFLKQFAGDGPWAHLDIAGTGWVDEPRPWQQKGATGVATRTLAELALDVAAG
jgi:leucyl aminopeptidase